MPKTHAFKPDAAPTQIGAAYPKPFDAIAPTRTKRKVGRHAGLSQFGVNHTVLPPGEESALRHWHQSEDEFVYILAGEVVLVTDDGEETMTAGMCAGFPAGVENGHHLVNRSSADAVYLEVGTSAAEDDCHYPDVDLHFTNKGGVEIFTDKRGDRLGSG